MLSVEITAPCKKSVAVFLEPRCPFVQKCLSQFTPLSVLAPSRVLVLISGNSAFIAIGWPVSEAKSVDSFAGLL